MRRRAQQVAEPVPLYMDPASIGELRETTPRDPMPDDFLVRAVLFGTGEIRKLRGDTEVYGLVLAGYQGLLFGDDGTYTGRVASELPLNRDGIWRVEAIIDEAVKNINPAYSAEYIGSLAVDEAAAMLSVTMKREIGVESPAEISWSNGMATFIDH